MKIKDYEITIKDGEGESTFYFYNVEEKTGLIELGKRRKGQTRARQIEFAVKSLEEVLGKL